MAVGVHWTVEDTGTGREKNETVAEHVQRARARGAGGGRQSQSGLPKRRKLLQTGISGGIRVCQQTRRTNPALGWTLAVARGFHLSRVPSKGAAGVEG